MLVPQLELPATLAAAKTQGSVKAFEPCFADYFLSESSI